MCFVVCRASEWVNAHWHGQNKAVSLSLPFSFCFISLATTWHLFEWTTASWRANIWQSCALCTVDICSLALFLWILLARHQRRWASRIFLPRPSFAPYWQLNVRVMKPLSNWGVFHSSRCFGWFIERKVGGVNICFANFVYDMTQIRKCVDLVQTHNQWLENLICGQLIITSRPNFRCLQSLI